MISRSDIFLHDGLAALEVKALNAVLRRLLTAHGSIKAVVAFLGWRSSIVERLLKTRFRDYPGPIILNLKEQDIVGLSVLAVRKNIRRQIVASLGSFGSGREIGQLLNVRECVIRRHRH